MCARKQILRGTIVVAGATSATATISVANIAKCELRYLGNTGESDTNDQDMVRIVLTNTTTITATKQVATGTTTTSWELTEFY